MNKLVAQLTDFNKALARLKEAAILPPEQSIHKDATIQRFEFTFELGWKMMQTLVNESTKEVYGPKQVIREAAKLGLIDDPVKWFEFLTMRNLSVHTYKEDLAQEVYIRAKEFISYAEKLGEKIKENSNLS
jgi:nucleotidyltransferase substrate binding protein (TIGR01987 family)